MKMSRIKNSRGASLVEALIAVAVSAMVMTSIFKIFITQNRVYAMEDQAEKAQRSARTTMTTMAREIRLAGYQSQSAKVEQASGNSFTFQADVDNDGVTEKVKFTIDGNSHVTRQVWNWNGASWVLEDAAKSVAEHTDTGSYPCPSKFSALSFTYLDTDGNVTATLSQIRVVRVALTAITSVADPVSGEHRTITLSSDITPRNLAY